VTHHRRKPDGPLTTRGTLSRLTTIRLPYEIEDAIKEEARTRGRPWQTVLKELLAESLGLEESGTEIKRISSSALQAAAKRLRRKA
jgi:hypothetical protein